MDSAAHVIAGDFYGYLTDGGTVPPRIGDAAWAIHHATRRMRDRDSGYPAAWAGYSHTGV
jgi:hypothetical protein